MFFRCNCESSVSGVAKPKLGVLVRILHCCALAIGIAFASGIPQLAAAADVKEAAGEAAEEPVGGAWVSLFNGKDLAGWKASENKGTFQIIDGHLVAKGPRSHLFYVGANGEAKFKDFEWKCEVMTKPNSNSGMYFHTEYQEEGWPKKGYEVQLNNTHSDPRKTGGLYAVADMMNQSPAEDGKWFTQHVIVKGNRVIVKVNGKVTTDYTEPVDLKREQKLSGRRLSSGTIALQGHDPGSEVHFRSIMIRSFD